MASRLFGGYSDTGKFVRDKAMRVLFPYIIVGLFLCLLQDRDIKQMLNGVSHLWFLLVIFECYMLGKIIEPILRWRANRQSLLFVSIIIFAVLVPYNISGIRILGISFLLKYFPLYVMGMIGASIDFQKVIQYRRRVSLFIIFSIIVLMLQQMFLRHPGLSNMAGMAVVLTFFTYMRTLQIGTLPAWMKSLD